MARRDRDERPPVELWQPESTEAPVAQRVEVGTASPSRRKALVGAAAAVALLGAGLVLGGGGSDDPEDDEPKAQEGSESTRRARTATSREETTTTRELFGPVLPEPVGAGLLLLGGDSAAIWLDLDTGERVEVDLPGLAAPSNPVPVRGGVALAGPAGVQVVSVPSGDVVDISSDGFQVQPSGSADSFWVVASSPSGEPSATLFDVAGGVLQPRVPLADGYMTSGTRHGLPRSRGGWSYLDTLTGTAPLGPGVLVDSSADSVAVHRCGDDGRCELSVYDLVDGAVAGSASFGDLAADFPDFQADLSPDGQLLLIQAWGTRSISNEVRDRAGQVRWRGESAVWLQSAPVWLPGGLGMILPGANLSGAPGSGRLVWFADGTDTDPAPIRAMIGTRYERMLLITR